MTQAMYTAITGIRANQTRLNVISNNIANVNTLGFKSSSANFATVFSNTISGGSAPNGLLGGTNPMQVGNGALISEIASNWGQGGTQFTGRNSDMMINGDGFFVVERIDVNSGNNFSDYYLTRAGNFTLDAQGNMVTSSGNRLRGSSDVSGSTPANLGRINLPLKFNVTKNLDADGTPIGIVLSPSGTSAATITAAQGGAASQLTVEVELQSFTVSSDGSIVAKYSNGDIITVRTDPTNPLKRELIYQIPGGSATGSQTFSVSNAGAGDAGPLSQVADGGATGKAVFDGGIGLPVGTGTDNGMDGRQFQIQLASVVNPAGLLYDGNNNFLPGANSGSVLFGTGATGSRGNIVTGALESSNVDLSGEFTNMIITQRGLEAASKMVRAQSEVLQTIIQMV
ncbi:MAG TPA: flagellar hook-basal body complex protein [Oculatellaceae cyanobacterium]